MELMWFTWSYDCDILFLPPWAKPDKKGHKWDILCPSCVLFDPSVSASLRFGLQGIITYTFSSVLGKTTEKTTMSLMSLP